MAIATFFSFLTHQSDFNDDSFSYGDETWPIYQEGHHTVHSRLRLVFLKSKIADILALLTDIKPVAIAALHREQSLIGLEVQLSAPLADDILQRLALIDQCDYLVIDENTQLPFLESAGLLVLDMDSTAIKIECIDQLAAFYGVGDEVAAITEQAMQGDLDFEQSLRARVAKLKGADVSIINELCSSLPLSKGLITMIDELQYYNWYVVLASGGFTPFSDHLKYILDLDAAFANELVIKDGKLTGEVTGAIVDAELKADILNNCRKDWRIEAGQSLAIGDGANDIAMIQAADFGVSYHAKPKLVAVADANIKQLGLQVVSFYLQR